MITQSELLMSLEIGLIYGIVTVGIYLMFRILDYADLTCDGSFVSGGAVLGLMMNGKMHPVWGLLGAACIGAAAGGLTGILHTRLRLSDLLSGILIGFMLYSINLRIMGGAANLALPQEQIFLSQNPILIFLGIGVGLSIFMIWLFQTDWGLALISVGQNKLLAQNSGVSLKAMVMIGLIISNALAALGGALFALHQGFSDIGSGSGCVIICLASLMIGEKIFPNRCVWRGILSCFLGSIAYRILISIALNLDFLGLQTSDLNLLTGILVILIVALGGKKAVSC